MEAPVPGVPQPRPPLWMTGLAIIPLAAAVVLAFWLPTPNAGSFVVPLKAIRGHDANNLAARLSDMAYHWPPRKRVPAIELKQFPGNMAALDATVKKKTFFRALLPLIVAENTRIEKQREFVKARFARGAIQAGSPGYAKLARIVEQYRVDMPLTDAQARATLLRRINTVPPALVLTQAAIESGWGTSRFAREANNLFGVWTWSADEGLAPRADPDGGHYLRVFPTLRASVRDYLLNINVGHAYLQLRKARAANRHADALALAQTLNQYSARGALYIKDVRAMIRHNELTDLAGRKLKLVAPERLVAN